MQGIKLLYKAFLKDKKKYRIEDFADYLNLKKIDHPSIGKLKQQLHDEEKLGKANFYNKRWLDRKIKDYALQKERYLSISDFRKYLKTTDSYAPTVPWLKKAFGNSITERLEEIEFGRAKKQFKKMGALASVDVAMRIANQVMEYSANIPVVQGYIREHSNLYFNRDARGYPYSMPPSSQDNGSVNHLMESVVPSKDALFVYTRKCVDFCVDNPSFYSNVVPEIMFLHKHKASLEGLLEYSKSLKGVHAHFLQITINGKQHSFERKSWASTKNDLFYLDTNGFIEILLYMLSCVGGGDVEEAYVCIWNQVLEEAIVPECIDKEDVLSYFLAAYNSYLFELEKSDVTSVIDDKKILKDYVLECRKRKIPPDVFYAEQWLLNRNFLSIGNDYYENCLEYYYGSDVWGKLPEQKKNWLRKTQANYLNCYKDFRVEDFYDIDRYKYVSKKIVWHQDPDAPYKAYTAFCIKIVLNYKNANAHLPCHNKTKQLWETNQLDYAVENLNFILGHPDIYKMQPKCRSFTSQLLVDVWTLWRYSGERLCAKFLSTNGYKVSPQWTFPDCKDKGELQFDIRAEKEGHWFLVEFDGEQHYSFPNYFHKSREEFDAQCRRDRIKDEYCKKNGIRLYRVRESNLSHLESVLPH